MQKSTLKPSQTPSKSRRIFTVILIILIAGGFVYLKNGTKNQEHDQSPTSNRTANDSESRRPSLAPVRTARAQTLDMPYLLTALGTITAKEQVTLTSRVNGELRSEHFIEGQYVNAGDLLFRIDPESYQIALSQAEGQLIKDQANLNNAQADVIRYQNLSVQNAVSQKELVTQKALVKQFEGTVKSSQAAVDNAKLQLSYTEITAPINGNVGLKQTSVGNYIQANNTPLLTIAQIEPIEALFSLPESRIPDLLNVQHQEKVIVEAWDRTQQHKLAQGTLVSLDNKIDKTTGTIQLKARFDNQDGSLFPNQFVNIRINLHTYKDALVIPLNALQISANGEFVWRIIPASSDEKTEHKNKINTQTQTEIDAKTNADSGNDTKQAKPNNQPKWEVEKVMVKTGIRNDQWVVITSNLNVNDTVVTDGVDRLTPNAQVEMVTQLSSTETETKH